MKTVNLILILLCSTLGMQAQNDTIFQTVSERLHTFQYSAPVEKIYVHQDRTQYAAGETIWFKVYQSSSGLYPVHSGIVYVDLIDGLNRPVATTKWKLTDGLAAGHIDLPDDVTTGFYQLRAYTLWMQNFDSSGFFTRELTISARVADPYALTTDFVVKEKVISASLHFDRPVTVPLKYSLKIGDGFTRSYAFQVDDDNEANLDIVLPNKDFNADSLYFRLETPDGNRVYPIHSTPPSLITFFPEGGDLVLGIPSKVAFKITDPGGHGLEGEGVVKDDSDNVVREFHSNAAGMGYFYFLPEAGKQYSVQLPELRITSELPVCLPEGVTLETKRWENMFRVTLRHNLREQKTLYLTIHQDGVSWMNAPVHLNESMSVVDIPLDKLPVGIFTLTVYDAGYHAYCERLAFVNYPEPLRLAVKTDKKTYGKRQKVTLQIEAKDGKNIPQSGNFSLSVVKAGLDNLAARNNFYTDYFLQSELKGRIENPASYFDREDSTALNNLDLLLLTHGWRRYSWEERLSGRDPNIKYPVERSLTFSGKVHPWYKGQSIDKMELNAMFRHDSLKEVIKAKPGPDGAFMFTDYDFCDTAEVVLSAQDKMERMLEISIVENEKKALDYYSYRKRMDSSNPVFVKLMGDLPVNSGKGIDKTVHKIPEIQVTANSPKKKSIYQLHDEVFSIRTYEVKRNFSYTAYGDFGDGSLGALGIIRFMSVRYRNLKLDKKTADDKNYILDGARISARMLTGIPPSLIDRIDLLTASQAMIYGISRETFYFHTRQSMSYDMPTKSVVYKFIGYNQQKEFYSPDYKSKKEIVVPDHRNTLYWQPDVVLNKEGKTNLSFFTSDEDSEFVILVEGRSAKNVIGVVEKDL